MPLKLNGGQLFLSLEIIDYATFALIVYLKPRHTLCWSVPYITPLGISSYKFKKRSVRESQVFLLIGPSNSYWIVVDLQYSRGLCVDALMCGVYITWSLRVVMFDIFPTWHGIRCLM